ncbi:MFS transporter [Microbacteriaceae bacterium VKM Ac-2855]|nr:MFS transporter [Microbacteriaceae bacterium VKM Ac-2855]
MVVPLSGLLVAQFVAALSGTIVATSVPTIMRSLEGPTSHSTWLVAATILTNTATTPIWGKLADRVNPKTIVLVAIGFFLVGSVVAGFTQDTSQLIAARATQGAGLGGLLSSINVVVASLVEPRQRGRVNSWLTSAQTTATLLGPVLGGVIVQLPGFGWRWCFFIAIPFAVGSAITIALTLRLAKRPVVARRRADVAGALLIGTGVAAVLISITLAGDLGLLEVPVLATAGYGIVALAVAVVVELRAADPVVPLRLLAQRTPLLVVIASFFVGTSIFGATVFVAQFLQNGVGLPPSTSGLLVVPMAIGTVVTAAAMGRFMARTGRVRPVLIAGVTTLLAGNVVLSMMAAAPIALMLVGTVLVASGLGALTQNLVLTAQNTVALQQVGAVSSTVMFFFFLGGTSALVTLGALLSAQVAQMEAGGATESAAYLAAVPHVFLVSACPVVLALAAVIALPRTLLRTSL